MIRIGKQDRVLYEREIGKLQILRTLLLHHHFARYVTHSMQETSPLLMPISFEWFASRIPKLFRNPCPHSLQPSILSRVTHYAKDDAKNNPKRRSTNETYRHPSLIPNT